MPQVSYPYGVSRIRSVESKLLSRERVESLTEADSAAECIKMLNETEYGIWTNDINSPLEYETVLSKELERAYHFIGEITPAPELTGIFRLKYDFHNLKVLFKDKYRKQTQEGLLVEHGVFNTHDLLEAITEEDYRYLPEYIGKAAKAIDDEFVLKIDPQRIDIILDRAMFSHIMSIINGRKFAFLKKYYAMQIDLINIRNMLRVRKMNGRFGFFMDIKIEGGYQQDKFYHRWFEAPLEQLAQKMMYSEYAPVIPQGIQSYLNTGSLSLYERLMDEFVLNWLSERKWNPVGLEPFIGYLAAKENEARILRVIMVGKINNMTVDTIRERLREVYG